MEVKIALMVAVGVLLIIVGAALMVTGTSKSVAAESSNALTGTMMKQTLVQAPSNDFDKSVSDYINTSNESMESEAVIGGEPSAKVAFVTQSP